MGRGTDPRETVSRSALRLLSPLRRSYSERPSLQCMHQQPPQAPRGPKRRARSAQRAAVAGRTIGRLRLVRARGMQTSLRQELLGVLQLLGQVGVDDVVQAPLGE